MILSYRREDYAVPLTSTCLIHTTGMICDGDSVSVTSPVFASMNFTSGAINTSDQFQVPIRIDNDEKRINVTEKIYGVLHCEDNDTFNMYVSVQ